MSNEDFQKVMLEGLKGINTRLDSIEEELNVVKKELKEVKKELKEVKEIALRTEEQVVKITEFKQGLQEKFQDIVNL